MTTDEFLVRVHTIIKATTPTQELYRELMYVCVEHGWEGLMIRYGSRAALQMMLDNDDIDNATTFFLWRSIYSGPSGACWKLMM